jgi:Lon protease-like protein
VSPNPFRPDFENLSPLVPIFPLAGVLLLPHGTLPLNIFEQRYLNMIADALKTDRIIGMIQPTGADDPRALAASGVPGPEVYPTGCAGRIVSFAETDDGRYLITLTGLARFDVGEELPLKDGYRRVAADYSPYRGDLEEEAAAPIERDRLMAALEHYFKVQNIDPNWSAIRDMDDQQLVTSLAMGCPFDASEKQALLEAAGFAARADILVTLMEMTGNTEGGPESTRH